MNPRHIPLLLLTLVPLAAVRPLDSAWRLVETTDDLTGATDKRLILRADAGQPLEPFGNELAAELRFDDQPRTIKAYLTILGVSGGRQVAFLGNDQSRYFSRPLFDQLTSATKLSLTYRAFSETHRVTFHVAGLNDALAQLGACQWTG